MNKLYSFLFLSLSLTAFSCSASEQPVVQYTQAQISDIVTTIREKDESLNKQAGYGFVQFINNADILKKTLNNTETPFGNKNLRLMMANSLDPLKQQVIFGYDLVNHINKTSNATAFALHYIDNTQKMLKNFSSTLTEDKIDQLKDIICNILNLTKPIDSSLSISNNEPEWIGDENVKMDEQKKQIFYSLQEIVQKEGNDISEQNITTLQNLQKFIEIDQQKEASAQKLADLGDAIKQGTTEIGSRLFKYASLGALAAFIYYCVRYTKLADFIPQRS